MDEHTSYEQAYKNGYDKGYEDGKRDARKKGEWLYDSGSDRYFCSNCREYALDIKTVYEDNSTLTETMLSDYCHNCGAYLRGEEDGNTV